MLGGGGDEVGTFQVDLLSQHFGHDVHDLQGAVDVVQRQVVLQPFQRQGGVEVLAGTDVDFRRLDVEADGGGLLVVRRLELARQVDLGDLGLGGGSAGGQGRGGHHAVGEVDEAEHGVGRLVAGAVGAGDGEADVALTGLGLAVVDLDLGQRLDVGAGGVSHFQVDCDHGEDRVQVVASGDRAANRHDVGGVHRQGAGGAVDGLLAGAEGAVAQSGGQFLLEAGDGILDVGHQVGNRELRRLDRLGRQGFLDTDLRPSLAQHRHGQHGDGLDAGKRRLAEHGHLEVVGENVHRGNGLGGHAFGQQALVLTVQSRLGQALAETFRGQNVDVVAGTDRFHGLAEDGGIAIVVRTCKLRHEGFLLKVKSGGTNAIRFARDLVRSWSRSFEGFRSRVSGSHRHHQLRV